MLRPSRLAATGTLMIAASAVLAQPISNVQLFGLMDAAVGRFGGPSADVNRLDKADNKLAAGGMSTSRFGMRGSEELGAGLVASFELSSFMRNNNGAAGRSDAVAGPVSVAGDPFWSQHAWVGVSSKALGRLRLGNSTSLLFLNSITSNAFGDSTVFSPLNLVTFFGSPLSGGTGWSNQVIYDTPDFGGLAASVAVSASQGQNGRNHAWRLKYATGPLALALVGQRVKKDPVTFADGLSPNNTDAWQLAASYDFSAVKVFSHFGAIRNRGTEAAPLDLKYRVWELGASVPLGSGALLASFAERKARDAVGPVPPGVVGGGNLQRRVFSLGYDHALSKRTDLYAVLMADRTRTRTLGAPPQDLDASANSYALGIRHRF